MIRISWLEVKDFLSLKKGLVDGVTFVNVHCYRPREIHEAHSHGHSEIFVVYKGHGTMVCDDGEIPVRAGDIILVAPGEKHGFTADNEDPLAYVCIGLVEGLVGKHR